MSFQKEYENYLVHSGIISEEELAHYGVPGMKWGVRKSTWKTLSRHQKRALKSYGRSNAFNTYGRSAKKGNEKAKAILAKRAKVKAKLEKVIGEKINEESARSQGRASKIMRTYTFGTPALAATLGIDNRRISRIANDAEGDYLRNKKKK